MSDKVEISIGEMAVDAPAPWTAGHEDTAPGAGGWQTTNRATNNRTGLLMIFAKSDGAISRGAYL
jgi:hypothetical protein